MLDILAARAFNSFEQDAVYLLEIAALAVARNGQRFAVCIFRLSIVVKVQLHNRSEGH